MKFLIVFVMYIIGKLPPDALPGNLATEECILGLEFSGKDEEGQMVMGLLPAKVRLLNLLNLFYCRIVFFNMNVHVIFIRVDGLP